MGEKLILNKICKEDIFCSEFEELVDNNVIEFCGNKIAVIYAPNGVGKTSLSKVLDSEAGSSFNVNFDGTSYNQDNNNLFFRIADQNGRNVIKGETEDFLLGDNIKREYELKNHIDKLYKELLGNLNITLKSEYNISKKTSNLLKKVRDMELAKFISDLANSKMKGKNIKLQWFIEKVNKLQTIYIDNYDEDKYKYFINDFELKDSIINEILKLKEDSIEKSVRIKEIEENTKAIEVMKEFSYKNECIVCDNAIKVDTLLKKKSENRLKIINSLDKKSREILEKVINKVRGADPFNIKKVIISTLESGEKSLLNKLQLELEDYITIINYKINNLFATVLDTNDLNDKFNQYNKMLDQKPELDEEDILFIERIVNENIEKKISLKRDDNNNLTLFLDENKLLNEEREQLHLSTGEQNFISLAFELLKAKKSDKKIIVIDDPISSFDSIYKNKIAFALIKFLSNKLQIILTHNTDLIRLLEFQKKNCFNLYLFNNIENEQNGFIRVNDSEKDILLSISKLIELFKNNIFKYIKDQNLFLISLVPFMRGYAQIIGDNETKNKLTQLMHGYNEEKINITEIYNKLFDNESHISESLEVSAKDIISDLNLSEIKIIDNEEYPLLNRTLKHSLIYLYIRLKVENKLVSKFSINTRRYDMLTSIIFKAFNGKEHMKERVFLISRKTLLNEFNHFDGNMNIFQPAIDISDTALEKEVKDIMKFIDNL
ncbi:AAA family ATPase [Clostridium sporogenes]|uniref:AAA family ATPase n=1 Tax=Clostridium sporogenes TaxID=1509 RepID=UPI000B24B0D9|nr:AAA family ATPase [Clostridium sporogenes]NFP68562.1 hypothetical protein [Clostridium sporogenes]UAL62185.1 AAA family ATPase [Clostridium sporogenes]